MINAPRSEISHLLFEASSQLGASDDTEPLENYK